MSQSFRSCRNHVAFVLLCRTRVVLQLLVSLLRHTQVTCVVHVVVVLLFNLFKVGQIYNSANIFTIQYIITNQNRLTKENKLIP